MLCRIFSHILYGCFLLCTLLFFSGQNSEAQQIYPTEMQEMATSQTNAASAIKAENTSKNEPTWPSTSPLPNDFDWIQLTSGEWLKGEFKALYDEKLEFDSDELDLLSFDWEDIKQVRGQQVFSVSFDGPVIVSGRLQVTGEKVFVITEDGIQEFDRNLLTAIAPKKPKEINYWSAKVSVGLNLSEGNTKQVQYNAKINIKRRTSTNRVVLDSIGNFTLTESEETADNQRVNGYFDMFRTRKYYLRPVFAGYFRDPFQNINGQGTIGAGIGYHIIDTSRTSWDVTGGLAYQYTNYSSVEANQDSSVTTPALAASTEFDIELTRNLDLIANYNFNVVNEESGQYTHHVITTLETEMTDWFDFDISFVWDHIQKPTAKADGTVPEKDDFKLMFMVGVEF